MPQEFVTRDGEVMRIQRSLERFHFPRLQMMLIVALTGGVGFIASFALLHVDIESLWIRYPISVVVAYAAFLFFLWCWLRLSKDDIVNGLDLPSPSSGTTHSSGCHLPDQPFQPGGGSSGGAGASASFHGTDTIQVSHAATGLADGASAGSTASDAAAGALSLEGLGLILLALAAVVGVACAVIWIIWVAPSLLAELSLDAGLTAGLYHRLRRLEGNHWLTTAIRRTWLPFAATALTFAVAGAALSLYAPEAKSIGQVISHHHEVR